MRNYAFFRGVKNGIFAASDYPCGWFKFHFNLFSNRDYVNREMLILHISTKTGTVDACPFPVMIEGPVMAGDHSPSADI